jgi:hypothetical protein
VSFAVSALLGTGLLGIIGALVAAFFISLEKEWGQYSLFYILFILIFQNLFIGLFGAIGQVTGNLAILTQIPFITVLVCFGMLVLQKRIIFAGAFKSMLFLCVFILVGLFHRGGLQNSLVQIRNMIMFYLIFEVVKVFLNTRTVEQSFYKLFMALGVIALLSGIILLIGGFFLYSKIGISIVYLAKGLPDEGISALPGRFTTDIFNYHLVRMGGLYYEPVTYSYLFAGLFIVALYLYEFKNPIAKYFMSFLFGIGLVLTGGKGGILLAGTICIAASLYKFLKMFIKSQGTSFMISFLITIAGASVFSMFYGSEYAGPAAAHFDTIKNTWNNVVTSPLGHGLAQGGFNTTDVTSMEEITSTGAESALMSIGYQIGLIGMAALIGVFVNISREVKMSYFSTLNFKTETVVKMLVPVTVIGVSLFQLNSLTPQAVIPLMVLVSLHDNRHLKTVD